MTKIAEQTRAIPGSSGSWSRFSRNRPALVAAFLLAAITIICLATLAWSGQFYNEQQLKMGWEGPQKDAPFGYDNLGRNMLARTLYGGAISLGIGAAAAGMAVVLGVLWGVLAGYVGGRVDNLMMRIVDIGYGLPYILFVILLKVALEQTLIDWFEVLEIRRASSVANIFVLVVAIGGMSWLTMARVIRGQVLSLKEQPFVEAARAAGVPTMQIVGRHLLPNLVGPIAVYAALTVPQAILQESFLSFLGIGIMAPVPTWGSLAAEGVAAINTVKSFWWRLVYPCGMLAVTLLCLNYVGDGLRDAFDPKATQPPS